MSSDSQHSARQGSARPQNTCGTQARYLFAGSSELKEFSWLSSAASCVSARRGKFTLFTLERHV